MVAWMPWMVILPSYFILMKFHLLILFVFVKYPIRGVGNIARYAFNGRSNKRQSATKLPFSCYSYQNKNLKRNIPSTIIY